MTRFAYSNGETWADLDGSSSLVTRYLRGSKVLELLARVAAGGTAAWLLADRMGTIRSVTDNSGVLIDTILYDGYGNIVSESSPANGGDYKFVGYRWDAETGLYRPDPTVGRVLVAVIGLWNSRDSLGFGAGDPNLIRYVCNNPTNATDPSGLQRGYSGRQLKEPEPEVIVWGHGLGLHGSDGYFKNDKGKLSMIRLAHREINDAGLTGTDLALIRGSNWCGCAHTYLEYKREGVGLWNTNAKKGDLPNDEVALPVLPAYRYFPLYRSSIGVVEGTGGKTLNDFTDDELWKIIRNHRLTSDYNVVLYNCQRWAEEASMAAGLYHNKNWVNLAK